jgi:hypothetical protein
MYHPPEPKMPRNIKPEDYFRTFGLKYEISGPQRKKADAWATAQNKANSDKYHQDLREWKEESKAIYYQETKARNEKTKMENEIKSAKSRANMAMFVSTVTAATVLSREQEDEEKEDYSQYIVKSKNQREPKSQTPLAIGIGTICGIVFIIIKIIMALS